MKKRTETKKKEPAKPPAKAAALIVQRLSLVKLQPHPMNPRRHPEPGTDAWNILKKSLENDYFDPMVWNQRNGKLVSGHLRRKVLEASGYTEADCVVVDYDEPLHLARMVAANKGAGENDEVALAEILQGIGDIELAGFAELPTLETELKALEVRPPPKMGWALIGCPLPQFGPVAAAMAELAKLPNVIIESTASDQEN